MRHELPVLLHRQARPDGQPADGAGLLAACVIQRDIWRIVQCAHLSVLFVVD